MRLLTLPTRAAWMLAAIGLSGTAVSAQTTAAPDKSPSPTLHATARLVIVDVAVTDNHGDPVKGLTQSDFRVIEDKTPQTIRNFEEHTSIADVGPAAGPPLKLEPGVFTNSFAAPVNSEVNVLMLDMINTPMMDQSFVRGQLLKYLATAKPGSRIAIFGLTTKLVMLQGFTADTDLLRRAVERSHPVASPLLAEKVGGREDIVSSELAGIEAQLSVSPQMAQAIAEFGATEVNSDIAGRVQATLHALNQLARYLSGIPGRKNLLWFSESFPVDFLPQMSLPTGGTALSPFAGEAAWASQYRETVNLLAQSRIAVYPVDARGLMPSPPLGESSVKYQRSVSNELFETHSSMFDMAEQTGGKAFVNTNGLAQAVEKVVDAGSNYYTLAYTPTDSKSHGEYRGIRVQLNGSNYKLAYRRGYYADTKPATPSLRDAMKSVALFAAPPSTQIPFYARVQPLPPEAEAAVAPGEVAPSRTELEKGHFVRYGVEYSVDPRGLSISTAADGSHHGHLEFVVLAYDPEGRKINSDVKTVQANWNGSQFNLAQQQGVRYEQEIGVPAKGEYTLRVVIHDLQNGKMGSLDVPLAQLKGLAPAH